MFESENQLLKGSRCTNSLKVFLYIMFAHLDHSGIPVHADSFRILLSAYIFLCVTLYSMAPFENVC